MVIAANKLTNILKKEIKKQIKTLKKKLKLVVFLIGNSPDQLRSVNLKKKIAKELGIKFELVHLKTTPPFERLIRQIKERANQPETTGIIIQQPLPAQLSTESIYQSIPPKKEIDGHLRKTPYYPPIGLAVLTILKSIYLKAKKDNLFVTKKDLSFFKKLFHHKKVVLIGRGQTAGQPIGRTLTEFKINYFSLNSKTANPRIYLQQADLIISAVGKKVIVPENLKPGVILINIGIRKEGKQIKGDYDDREIKKMANFYLPANQGINKGVMPLSVVCLYQNLLQTVRT